MTDYKKLVLEDLKKYKNAKDFSNNYIKDIAELNNNIYDYYVYGKIDEASGLKGYKTDWFPAKVKTLSDNQINKILDKYPDKTIFENEPETTKRHCMFYHFLPEYRRLQKEGFKEFYNKNIN